MPWAALNHVFLLWARVKKSLKATDLGKNAVLCPTGPWGAILVPGRLGAAFHGKQMVSFILMFTKQLSVKALVTAGPSNLFGKKKAIGNRSTNFSPSYKLKNGRFNSAEGFPNEQLPQSDVLLGSS